MYLYFLCFFSIFSSCFALSEREERKARFLTRTRQKKVLKEDTIDALNSFFFEGNLGLSSLQSSSSRLSYNRNGNVFSDIHITPKNPVDFTWNINAGWMFYGYASAFAGYENRRFLLSLFTNPTSSTSSEAIFTQQGQGEVELHVGFFGSKLFLAKMFGVKNPTLIPFIGAEIGYAAKRLFPICLQDQGEVFAKQKTGGNRQGGFAYKALLGGHFFLQKHVLMNIEWSYADMGSVQPSKFFFREDFQGVKEPMIFRKRPEISLRSFALTVGCTFVM